MEVEPQDRQAHPQSSCGVEQYCIGHRSHSTWTLSADILTWTWDIRYVWDLLTRLSKPDLCQGVGLIDWDELGSKAKANQGDPHLLAAHDGGTDGDPVSRCVMIKECGRCLRLGRTDNACGPVFSKFKPVPLCRLDLVQLWWTGNHLQILFKSMIQIQTTTRDKKQLKILKPFN